jgi:hypothetical protein
MRDTQNDGKFQRMYFMRGGEKVAKGMKIVLEEAFQRLGRTVTGCVTLLRNTQTSKMRRV